MAQYGSNNLTITCTDSGATIRTMTSFVRTLNGLDVQAILVEGHVFGDTWVKSLFTNIKKGADVTMGGYYDDTATTGPNVVFNSPGDTRSAVIGWGSTKTSTFNALIVSYKRLPVLNDLTKFEVTLRPSGTITEV